MFSLGFIGAVVLATVRPWSIPPPPPVSIYGGEPVAPGAWPEVVAISAGSFACTGTLVSSNLVLTAAHCLAAKPGVETIAIRRGDDINQPQTPIAALAYGASPEFCGEEDCKNDIQDYGYIILAKPQTDLTQFPRVVHTQDEWDEVMAKDALVTVVGYGLTDSGTVTGIKRQVEIPITSFSSTGHEFQAGGMGLDTCQGDSGGPAFAQLRSGEWVLVGITSRGYTCGQGGFYAVPLAGACWLYESSGFDLRPPECDECDCIITDPNRSEGCGCTTTGAPLGLLPLVVLGLTRRRRHRSTYNT